MNPYKKDFDKYDGYSEPLEMNDNNFIFTIQGNDKFRIHIYLGKQSPSYEDGYRAYQLLILNHPSIGIYHDQDDLNRNIGIDIKIIGVDDV